MRLIAAVNSSLDAELAVRTIFEAPTVRSLSQQLETNTISAQELVSVHTLKKGIGIPLFCIHSAAGASWPYRAFGNYLDCQIIGIEQTLRDGEVEPQSISDMAKNYADRIQENYPSGPYNLVGWSFGGVLAHEIAIDLQRRRCVIGCLILLDAQPSLSSVAVPKSALKEQHILQEVLQLYRIDAHEQDEPLTFEQIEELVREQAAVEFPRYKQLLDLLVQNVTSNIALYRAHEPRVFDGDIVVFAAARDAIDRISFLADNWRPYTTGEVTVYSTDCTHQEMLTAESVSMYGKQLKDSLFLGANVNLKRPQTLPRLPRWH
jgi:thioesterase domain-containing protein